MEDGHYARNVDRGEYRGPYDDLMDAMDASGPWKEAGDEVTIHMVEDGDIVGSWEYSDEGLEGNSDFDGDAFEDMVADDEQVPA